MGTLRVSCLTDARIGLWRERLYAVCSAFCPQVLTPERLTRLTGQLAETSGLSFETLDEFVRPLAGFPFSESKARYVAHRLAGQRFLARRGKVIRLLPPVAGQAAHVIRILEADWLPQRRGAWVRLDAWSGPLAGKTWSWVWSPQRLRYVADKAGFFKRLKNYGRTSLVSPAQLVQFQVLVALSWENKKVRLLQLVECPTLTARNHELVRKRWRLNFPCPLGLGPQHPCHNCPKGYRATLTTTACPVACRPYTYLRGICSRCQKETWVAEIDTEKVCLFCRKRPV